MKIKTFCFKYQVSYFPLQIIVIHSYYLIFYCHNVVKLKGRTRTLLPMMSQGIRCSKKQWVACCICRQNSWHLNESSNCPRLDEKQVVCWTNKRNEMWQWSCVNWIPLIATPKERSDERNGLPQNSKQAQMCLACVIPEV